MRLCSFSYLTLNVTCSVISVGITMLFHEASDILPDILVTSVLFGYCKVTSN